VRYSNHQDTKTPSYFPLCLGAFVVKLGKKKGLD
jgi:hypothetical protein